MERIQFYPEGENPKGKNYIFFAAHPEDMKHGFISVKQEIFEVVENCVIWYDATPEKPINAAFWQELQLLPIRQIVIWVTSRLLNHSGSYIQELRRYAGEHQIGILPVIRETRLEESYKQHFGYIQYLDATAYDPTAISYKEKLKRKLQAVFTSAEDFQRVRDAFSGYIFLSYRKKDRLLANQLMKKIHACKNMEDVAIWYDEFLVPGESFREGIQDALKDSDLFALLVTHNLLEPGNFVLMEEFPAAKAAGMEILPIQMSEVNRGLLRGVYDQLPKNINGNDHVALEESLHNTFSVSGKQEDQEHAYLIGLAYWNGIDVEQDHQRGLNLIMAAAKAGMPDAIQTLASIYKQKAFSLHLDSDSRTDSQHHCQLREYLYHLSPTADNAIELAQAYLRSCELEGAFRGDPAVAAQYCAEALTLLRKQTELSPDRAVYHSLIDTYGTKACLLSSTGKTEDSLAAFTEGENLCEKLYKETDDIAFLRQKGRMQQKTAETMIEVPNVRGAMRACKRCRQTAEKLLEVGDAVWGNRLLRDIYESFAKVYAALRDEQQIEQSTHQMLRYAKASAEASGDQVDYLLYMQILDDLGEIYLSSGDNKLASPYYEQIVDACKMIKTDWLPEGFRRRYMKILTNRGQNLYHLKKFEEAASTFEEAYDHALSLMNTTKDASDQYNAALILYLWGCADNNLELLEQSRLLLMPIRKQYPTNAEYRNLEDLLKKELGKRKE